MKSKVDSIEEVKRIPFSDIPDGEYAGVWSGYRVAMWIEGSEYRLTTVGGIRGTNVPCVVRINGGVAIVESAR